MVPLKEVLAERMKKNAIPWHTYKTIEEKKAGRSQREREARLRFKLKKEGKL